jgi:hypothetical protein
MLIDARAAIALRLALIGRELPGTPPDPAVAPLLARQRELSRRLSDRLSAPDQRIQDFLDDYVAGTAQAVRLPRRTLVLDQPGLARELSLPQDGDAFSSELLSSYRLRNGVLHNPASDRRTTAGVFHIAEGGLPIPDDKIAVPRGVAARIFAAAFEAPADWLRLPYAPVECWVSLLLRPLVRPAVPGVTEELRLETRFIVPGGLVANLDFVESIFGNAGDPYLPENDASLDPAHWTGHTGLVVLAPHLTRLTKKSLGLPHIDAATDRQRRDGQCWSDETDLYNGGDAFKLCLRDERGVMATVIADNYFGYCKKEVKTQISYSANLLGNTEEEHAGGAIVFPAYNLGQEFTDKHTPADATLDAVVARDPQRFVPQPDGTVLDTQLPQVTLVPGHSTFSLRSRTVEWDAHGVRHSIPLDATRTYVMPSGYRVHAKHRETDRTQWHFVGTSPVVTHCHKPATVSGGGKSEISKSILDAFVFGDAYAADFEADIDAVAALIDRDYSNRFADPALNGVDMRPVLGAERSFGSVIKLLTPSSLFNQEYNEFLSGIPAHVKELLFTVKRYYQPSWGDDWRSHFSVGITNGRQGNAVRLDGAKIVANFLRVGFNPDGSWRIFSTRPDFTPASKVQTEDDITASVVVPPPGGPAVGVSRKVVQNCETRLFQRPDDAIEPGYDKQTESDMARPDTFISNFQPLTRADAVELVADVQEFSKFTAPMADLVRAAASDDDHDAPDYFVCSAMPRLVGGKPSKNPRYLQLRADLAHPTATALADLSTHLYRSLPMHEVSTLPVDIVVAGRRNNPADAGVPPLCSYNPLHYMELPELFAEFISSMTGKSPSTTGAGSEGAMTKGPFNALPAVLDLNAALLSFVLCGYDGWLSSAGYIGPRVKVAHDISMLIPELFCRMGAEERSASALIEGGYLEKLTDFTHNGQIVRAGRLGYRINERFMTTFFGRIFLHPHAVFTDEMLRPELQDADAFAESMATIVATHERVARAYIEDGTIELAVPPLRALLEIMAKGTSAESWTFDSPEFRALFTRSSVLESDWYAERIAAQQASDVSHATQGVALLERFLHTPDNDEASERLGLGERLTAAKANAKRLASNAYRKSLIGMIGRQPI